MRQIEVRHLLAFIAIAEELSYRKASLRLHTSQPALSRAIQQLEQSLGARLLERNTRVRLTEIGQYFLEQARDIVARLGDAAESVRRMTLGEKGQLFVGFNDFTISEILPPVIHEFRKRFPDVVINLSDEPSARMLQMVGENRLDVAFLSGISPPPELDSLVLREEKFVAVLPPGHTLQKRRTLTAKDLSGEPFVMGVPTWSVFLKAVDTYCDSAGFRPRIVQTVINSNDIMNFVAAGIGVSIYVDRGWLRNRSDIVVRPMVGQPTRFKSIAVWRRSPRSPSLAKFITVMREVLPK